MKGLELERIHSAEGYTNVVHGTYDEAWESIKTQVQKLCNAFQNSVGYLKFLQ